MSLKKNQLEMSSDCNFCANDLKNPGSLANKLRASNDPLSHYILDQFNSNTKQLLNKFDDSNVPSEKLKDALVDELNQLIEREHLLQDVENHAQVKLTENVKNQFGQNPQGKSLIKFNKLLLQTSYPQALLKDKVSTGIHVDKIIYTPSVKLGPRASYVISNDPKRMVFILSRYKFCAKLLQGKTSVLEVGCGDAFGSPIVAQSVERLFCVDCESRLIDGNNERLSFLKNIEFHTMDMINNMPKSDTTFDAAFSIDVIEHIEPELEEAFITNICKSLKKDGMIIIGTPNIEAERFESEPGASPHINLKNHTSLKQLLDRYFVNSFIFSMNDEVIHTGFYPMAHYLFGIGIGVRDIHEV